MLSDLQVDVNGQGTFSVSMKLLASVSGKLRKFGKLSAFQTGSLKLILHDFPGGAEGFELIVRFCYNGGRICITPSNVLLLHSAARFLEINEDETKKYLESARFWTWSELLDCLKQCQELLSFMSSSCVVQEILNALVEKISSHNISSPFAFSCSEYSSTHFSGDISTNSSRSSSFQTTNWLQDLEFLNIDLFEKVLSIMMISQKLDHRMVCSFLLHYLKVRFIGLLPAEKCKITEVVINSPYSVNEIFKFPFRSLCDILRACSTLKMKKCWVNKVEKMIGSRLDEATLDDLLVPSPRNKTYAYDVNLILRFLKIFLHESRNKFFVQRLKNVGFLMDLYLAEVVPDPHLKPCKLLALVRGLPDSARDSHDTVCGVIDMYFKVHRFISEEEKIIICSALNYDKLSSESLVNLVKNTDFPVCAEASALNILQSKLKSLSKAHKNLEFRRNSSLSADKDEKILVHLLEGKECRKVQKTSANVARINVTCPRTGNSLPRLCS